MLGDPDLETSLRFLKALVEGGADALELGIPFSDPVADGPTIQAAAVRALEAGVRPEAALDLVADVRRFAPDIPMGLLTYANLVVGGAGLDASYRRFGEVGLDSVLVADVPAREIVPFAASAREHGVAPVLIAAPNTPPKTVEVIAREGAGYTYCVSRPGVTGADSFSTGFSEIISQLRAVGAPPPVVGFGISTPEDVRRTLDAGAEGAISGSAIVRFVERHDGDVEATASAIQEFVASMKNATRGVRSS
jgi:tryptophan synthase alpha chain